MLSSPATPTRRTRPGSASPTKSHPNSNTNSPGIVTPGQKIKATLARFDDSESEDENEDEEFAGRNKGVGRVREEEGVADGGDDEDDDEEEGDIVMPRGRMAARMQMQQDPETHAHTQAGDAGGETAFERVSRMMRENKDQPKRADEDNDDGEDDLPTAGRRPRMNNDQDNEECGSPARSVSPLFMSSPTKNDDAGQTQTQDQENDDGSDDDQPQPKNARFLALVAQKRKEREEKEKAEAAKKEAQRTRQAEQDGSDVLSEDSNDEEANAGAASRRKNKSKKQTEESRPARKASKKALEEMHRETQRMSRNMQLAHQAKTKKKISKESFFARFNFGQSQSGQTENSNSNSSTTAGSQQSSDGEGRKERETPHTSPLMGPSDKAPDATDGTKQVVEEQEDLPEELPSTDNIISGTAKARDLEQPIVNQVQTQPEISKPKQVTSTQPVRVRLTRKDIAQRQRDDSSDDDLEVVTSPGRSRGFAAFENLGKRENQESASMQKLRMLANLTSPGRSASMNSSELFASLLQNAKKQAASERMERMQELKDKGVVIETAEDRAAMEDTIEDLMARARKEGEDIARQERAAAQRGDDGDDGEEDDVDYVMSGSEEEGDDEGENEDEDEGEGATANDQALVEVEAGEDDESEDGQTEAAPSNDEAEVTKPRRKRPTRVISDDEDEDVPAPATPAKQTPQTQGSAQRPQFPDLQGSNGVTMSLTQAFAGTLANQDGTQGEFTVPHSLPEPDHPDAERRDSQVIVKDSQEQRPTTDIWAGYAQSDGRVSESPARPMSQFSQVPEPTQDAGFMFSPYDPSKRFMSTPASTVETVLLSQKQHPSPQKKGRLQRGKAPEEVVEGNQGNDVGVNPDAFNVMKKATKKLDTPFDRKKSKAKEVVEDAAEESDDEYAGLGGGSDDSDGEEDAYDKQMINDSSAEKVDEKQLAALNAYVLSTECEPC